MGRRETNIQNTIRLALSAKGVTTFRNNVGVAQFPDGSRVEYGLCPGSSDLIGWTPVTITPEMVGRTIAVFTAIEVKQPGKYPSANQRIFLANVTRAGGISGIARSPEDALNITESF
jgi:hypothetical protein